MGPLYDYPVAGFTWTPKNPKTDEIEHDAYKWLTIDEIKQLANNKIPIYLLEKALEISKNENNS